jgi:gliding motility-associated-like protein
MVFFCFPKTKRFNLFFCCLLLQFIFCTVVLAQKETYHWIFGPNYHLDFNQKPVAFSQDVDIVKDTGQVKFFGSTACMADKEGRLLLYTNSETVWNRKHSIVLNGSLLKGNKNMYYKNNAVIVPIEDFPGRYYLFTLAYVFKTRFGGEVLDSTIYYHIIDMNANNGDGEIISKNNQLAPFECNTLAAVKHANGRDTWVVSRNTKTYNMVAWLVSPCGISKPIFSKTKGYNPDFFGNSPVLVLSPNGKIATMAQLESEAFFSPAHCYFYDFNDNTGVFQDKTLILEFNSRPLVFSNNSRFVYNGWGNMEQYDLEAGTDSSILTSKTELWKPYDNVPVNTGSNNSRLAPDGRILINPVLNNSNVSSIYAIQYPNIRGREAQLDSAIILLPKPKRSPEPPYDNNFPSYSFPYFISSFFRPDYKTPEPYQFQLAFQSQNITCYKDSLSIALTNDVQLDSVLWELRNAANQTVWLGKGKDTKMPPMPSGVYSLVATAYWRCLSGQIAKPIVIEADPIAKINDNVFDTVRHCNSEPVLLQANEGSYSYSWNTGETTQQIRPSTNGLYTLNTTNTCGTAFAKALVEDDKWEIPNVITPNGDGINDEWRPKSFSGAKPEVKILNRWGSIVFQEQSYANNWQAENLPDGMYFYQLTSKGDCLQKGWVQVLR